MFDLSVMFLIGDKILLGLFFFINFLGDCIKFFDNFLLVGFVFIVVCFDFGFFVDWFVGVLIIVIEVLDNVNFVLLGVFSEDDVFLVIFLVDLEDRVVFFEEIRGEIWVFFLDIFGESEIFCFNVFEDWVVNFWELCLFDVIFLEEFWEDCLIFFLEICDSIFVFLVEIFGDCVIFFFDEFRGIVVFLNDLFDSFLFFFL